MIEYLRSTFHNIRGSTLPVRTWVHYHPEMQLVRVFYAYLARQKPMRMVKDHRSNSFIPDQAYPRVLHIA